MGLVHALLLQRAELPAHPQLLRPLHRRILRPPGGLQEVHRRLLEQDDRGRHLPLLPDQARPPPQVHLRPAGKGQVQQPQELHRQLPADDEREAAGLERGREGGEAEEGQGEEDEDPQEHEAAAGKGARANQRQGLRGGWGGLALMYHLQGVRQGKTPRLLEQGEVQQPAEEHSPGQYGPLPPHHQLRPPDPQGLPPRQPALE